MAEEYLLAIAGACLLAAATIAVVRQVRRRAYEPRHTAEQPVVEHVGVTETSPLLKDLPLKPPPPPVDPRVLLAEAEGELIRAQRRVEELRALVEVQDNDRLRIALDALQGRLVDRLRRAGHADMDTAELSHADIRRIVRSGAP